MKKRRQLKSELSAITSPRQEPQNIDSGYPEINAAINQEISARGLTDKSFSAQLKVALEVCERFGLLYSRIREDGQKVWGKIPRQKNKH
jgi:hypothetical protein